MIARAVQNVSRFLNVTKLRNFGATAPRINKLWGALVSPYLTRHRLEEARKHESINVSVAFKINC
jgi:hypothetical protein